MKIKLFRIRKIEINPKNILLVRTDRIGDVILTLPVIDTLTACYPHAKIDFLVNKRVSELVLDYPNINKVHTIEKETVNSIRKICQKEKYDLVVVVYPRFSIALGVFLAGIKYRLGTKFRWYSFLFNIRHSQHRKYSIKHEMEYNLDLLQAINCNKINTVTPILNVSDEYVSMVMKIMKDLGIDTAKIILTIHIPSLGSAKVWSNENFINLINLLAGENINILLTGTGEDKQQIKEITDNITGKNNVYTVTGLSLKELAALLKLSKLFIGNSSGPIHIAAAVGTFVIGLYSPVKAESPVRWGPVTGKKKIFVPEKDDGSRDVMDDIKPEEVFRFIIKYLKTLH